MHYIHVLVIYLGYQCTCREVSFWEAATNILRDKIPGVTLTFAFKESKQNDYRIIRNYFSVSFMEYSNLRISSAGSVFSTIVEGSGYSDEFSKIGINIQDK